MNNQSYALYQMAAALNILCRNEKLKLFIDSCKYKYCLISCRPNNGVATPLGVADGFMEPYKLVEFPISRSFKPDRKSVV